MLYKPGKRVCVETPHNVWIGTVVDHSAERIILTDVINGDLHPVRDKRVPAHRIVSMWESRHGL